MTFLARDRPVRRELRDHFLARHPDPASFHQEAAAAGAWPQRHAHHVSAVFRHHLRIVARISRRRTYQNLAGTRRSVVAEAASLSALYCDISEYPEPYRADLRKLVREYAPFTIEDAWPKQRRGIMPELSGPNPVAGIYKRMAQFEPGTEGQDAIHQTALKQFNSFIEARRARLYRVTSGMPRVVWYTVALGALVNMIFLWLFDLRVSTISCLADSSRFSSRP